MSAPSGRGSDKKSPPMAAARPESPSAANRARARSAIGGKSKRTSFSRGARRAAADVEQTPMLCERIGVQDFAGHERLRDRHQARVSDQLFGRQSRWTLVAR